MSIPNYQTFMLPVLKSASTGERYITDVVDEMATQFNISDEERSIKIASGTGLFYGRVSWAVTYLVQAGLLKRVKRGCFIITEEGQKLLDSNPKEVNNKTLLKYKSFLAFKERGKLKENKSIKHELPIANEELSPEENIQKSIDTLNETISDDLLNRIIQFKPKSFETLMLDLLDKMGYSHDKEGCQHTGKTGDEGIDGIVNQDVLGVDKIYIQAKKYARGHSIGSQDIRNFMGTLDLRRATKGIFVTTSEFTSSAVDSAKQATRNVVLINGTQLADLMIKYNVGCETKKTIAIKRIDEDYFEDK